MRKLVFGFLPGQTQTKLYNPRRWLEACFQNQKLEGYVSKTKALICCVVTMQLICVFVFAYAKNRFSHDAAQLTVQEMAEMIIMFFYVIIVYRSTLLSNQILMHRMRTELRV